MFDDVSFDSKHDSEVITGNSRMSLVEAVSHQY